MIGIRPHLSGWRKQLVLIDEGQCRRPIAAVENYLGSIIDAGNEIIYLKIEATWQISRQPEMSN